MPGELFEQLDSIFAARSVAVIGGSNDMRKWGGRIVQRLLLAKYQGAVYVINIAEERVQGLPTYRTVRDVPDDIDLVAIAIPAARVPQVLKECVAKGVKGAAIISADFAETGGHGRLLQQEIVDIARQGGMRLIGPNCQGVWNSANHLNLVLSSVPQNGPISIISGSGNFSHVFADFCTQRGWGVSKVISMGNQADLDAADYLEFLADDPDTGAIFLYLEGFRDGRKLFQASLAATRKKPVVVYKAARNQSVARIASSHTAAIAGEDRVFDAMCKQAGLIRSDDLLGSLVMAAALSHLPLPKGNRIGIMGMGGQGVVTSDICVSMGMEIPTLNEAEIRFIMESVDFPPQANLPRNPIDFAGGTQGGLVEAKALNMLAQLDSIDGLIANQPGLPNAMNTPAVEREQMMAQIKEYLTAISRGMGKPLIIQALPGFGRDSEMRHKVADVALVVNSPEEAARAMYGLVRYSEIRRRFEEEEAVLVKVPESYRGGIGH